MVSVAVVIPVVVIGVVVAVLVAAAGAVLVKVVVLLVVITAAVAEVVVLEMVLMVFLLVFMRVSTSLVCDAAIVVAVLEVTPVVVRPIVEVVRALPCTREAIGMAVEMLAVGMRVDVLITVPGAAVVLLMDALAGIVIIFVNNISAGMLADVNRNAFAGVMTSFEFAIPSREFRCRAAFDCRPMGVLDSGNDLQAWMPSCHVCSWFK